jgi:putative hemolysin
MASNPETIRLLTSSESTYAVRLAREASDVRAAQALRFAVFNLELNEGLESSQATQLDEDPFDTICDHLLVEHLETKEVVGTYRLQMGNTALANRGYYSEQEFDFSVFEPMRAGIVELGRACVHQQHRNMIVLGLLWKGIADYAKDRGGRYLCGCSSITTQDPAVGASAYAELSKNHLAPPEWQTKPTPAFHCPMDQFAESMPKIPKLLRAYLSLGAKICGPPALDRDFKTIDFLTILDLEGLTEATRARFMS